MSKFYLSKLTNGAILAWNPLKTKYTKSFVYMETFNSYEDFKITDKIYQLTKNKKIVKLNF